MFNPYDVQQIDRLHSAVRYSRQVLQRFRENYRELIEEFVTTYYTNEEGANDERRKVIINLLGMAVEIHVLHLAPQSPQVTVSSKFREYAPIAYDAEIALNNDLEEQDFETVLREVAMDAWFSVGIAKLYLDEGNEIEVAGEHIDVGHLKVASVSIDNWVHDATARKFTECEFYGDKQRVRLSDLIRSGRYENLEGLQPHYRSEVPSYDEFGEPTAADLSTAGYTSEATDATLSDYVEIWDLFLPKEQLLITITADHYGSGEYNLPLRVVNWTGPKHGPYHMVTLSDVPENIMPSSPGMQLFELHNLVNNLFRKLKRQAKRQKDLTFVKAGADEDARRVQNAADGEIIGVNNPNEIIPARFGGVDAQNHGFAVHLMSEFDRQAGNLNLLGGLSPSADTLGQERILEGQTSARMQIQKNKMAKFARNIVRDIAWYRWHDVFYNPTVMKEVPGTNVQVAGSFSPHDRLGRFLDYNFDISPFSMEYMPPSAKLALLERLLGQSIFPMIPMMQEQGIMLNVEQIIKTMSRHANMPELLEAMIFTNGEAVFSPQPMSGESVMRPPVTRRENVRINRPGSTQRGSEQILAQQLLGGGTSQAQRESVFRPNG